jgi:hypothetical protein
MLLKKVQKRYYSKQLSTIKFYFFRKNFSYNYPKISIKKAPFFESAILDKRKIKPIYKYAIALPPQNQRPPQMYFIFLSNTNARSE